jgi:hypothetical protein
MILIIIQLAGEMLAKTNHSSIIFLTHSSTLTRYGGLSYYACLRLTIIGMVSLANALLNRGSSYWYVAVFQSHQNLA